MPGWTAPDSLEGTIATMQMQIRQLQTYMATPLFASSVLWKHIASASQSPASAFGANTSWQTTHTLGFTLSAQQTVAFIAPLNWVGNGGTANYINTRGTIDGNPYGGQYSATNGAGYQSTTIVVFAPNLAAGSHQATIDCILDSGSGTTYTENHATWNVQMDVFIIGA